MKHISLILISSILLGVIFYACNATNSNPAPNSTTARPEQATNEPDYAGGFSAEGRLFPDKLRNIPVGITVAHYPNPCFAVMEDSMYIWKHSTTIQTNEDLQIVEYGAFVYTAKGWYLRVSMNAGEFAETYQCKNGLLKKGVVYTDNQSWRRDKKLSSGDAMWYYLAKDKSGRMVKGTGVIETEGKLTNSTRHGASIKSSSISWTGYGEIGGYSLSGTVPVKNASVELDSASISAVNLTIAVSALASENKDLVTHLKGEDFFEVDKYPTASFSSETIKYKDANNATVTGVLTIKQTSKKIEFPVLIQNKGANQSLSGKIVIDRTDFGIRYNSKSFFSNLGDQAIKNNFDLEFYFLIN